MVMSGRGMPIGIFSSSGSRIGARHESDRQRQPSAPCEAQLWSGVFLKARSEALQALRRARLVEAREGDRLAAGVDAVHQRLLWSQLGLAAQRDKRLDPGPGAWRSSLAHLRIVGH